MYKLKNHTYHVVQVSERPVVLITDFDGTILESMPMAWEYIAKIVKIRKKLELTPYKNYLSSTHFYLEIFARFGFGAFGLLPRMRRYMYLNDTRITAYNGAIDALKRLQVSGIITAIVTDNDEDFVERTLKNNGLESLKNIEIYSREKGNKLVVLIKLLRKYRACTLYFASHDLKDFYLLDVASLLNGKSVTKIFTPNEIDKKDWFTRTVPFAQIVEIVKH